MSDRLSYFFLNFQGICSPPSYQEVKKSDLSGRPFTLIPDNNVCTHTSEYNSSPQDKTKRAKVKNFLNYCFTSNITILPYYGLLERASIPGTLELNKNKLINCENEFWKKLGHYYENDRISNVVETIEPLKAVLHPLYAYLLMIKIILIERAPSRANAKRNIQDLYQFTKQIGVNLPLAWQFAIAIFGGSTELNRFIKPKKGKDVFQALWGAAWDLFYIQTIHEYSGIREIENNSYPQFILVTDDKACSTIGDFAKAVRAFNYGDIIYNEVMMNADFPHLNEIYRFLSEILFELDFDRHQRAVARTSMSEFDLQNDIEKTINRADSSILELTKQLQLQVKKGFG